MKQKQSTRAFARARLCTQGSAVKLLCLFPLAAASYGTPMYELTIIENPSGGSTWGMDINESGQVAGHGHDHIGRYQAFRWSPDGTFQFLGTLGGNSSGNSINDSGQVAGTAADGLGGSRAFFFDGTTMNYLPTFGGNEAAGAGVNNLGQVTGWAETIDGKRHGFVYSGGTLTDISPSAGHFQAGAAVPTDINDAGQVSGYFEFGPFGNTPFLYEGTPVSSTTPTTVTWFEAINENGELTGAEPFPNWLEMRAINTPGNFGEQSWGHDINNAGQVVGRYNDGRAEAAFIYDTAFGFIDLNDAVVSPGNVHLLDAFGINESGEIVGWALTQIGYQAFVLTPINTPDTSGGMISMLLGLCTLGFTKRKLA